MREGIRRVAVVIKWLSCIWLAICAVFVVWGFLSSNPALKSPALSWLAMSLWGIGGLLVAWVIEGFAKRD
jgi:hypothetical protein